MTAAQIANHFDQKAIIVDSLLTEPLLEQNFPENPFMFLQIYNQQDLVKFKKVNLIPPKI